MKSVLMALMSFILVQSLSAQNKPHVYKAFQSIKGKTIHLNTEKEQLKTAPANLSSVWQSKVDPSLTKFVFTNSEKQLKKGLNSSLQRTEKQKVTVFKDKAGKLKAPVFIEFNSGSAGSIEGFELRRISPEQNIAIGYIEIEKIESVALNKSVVKIQAAKFHKRKKVEGIKSIQADVIHASSLAFPNGVKGKDVIVGVLDTGIDFDLDVFGNQNGTRIQYLLEYTMTESGSGNITYGQNEWTKAQIDANPASVTAKDGYGGGGHGTHVTSIAAGNDANGSYPTGSIGVAPESDIIFVKGDRDPDSNSGFSDDDIVDGVAYIIEKAELLGKPVVVNLSLGGNYGPLDGTDLYEQYLTQLTGDGKVIIAAAGNEGFDFLHTGYANDSESVVASVDIPWDDISFDKYIWSDAGVISAYKIIALNKDTYQEVGSTQWLTKGSSNWNDVEAIRITDMQTNDNAGFVYHYSNGGVNSQNGDEYIQIYVYDGYDSDDDEDYAWIDDYVWAIAYQTTNTTGRIDVINGYASSSPETINVTGATFIPGDQALSVGSPATAKNVVSVGAYVTNISWQDINNSSHQTKYPMDFEFSEYRNAVLGELAYFSSRGPTRDNRLAPIVSAPGDLIFSNRSYDISNNELEEEYMTEGGKLIGYQGTSMATPFVTGTVALMLQVNPDLNYEDIVDIFSRKSVKDNFTGSEASTLFGHGKLNAYESVLEAYNMATSNESNSDIVQEFSLLENYPNPFNPTTTIRFSVANIANVSVKVYDSIGREVVTLVNEKQYSKGVHQIQLNASGLSSGVYWIRMKQQNQNGSMNYKMHPVTLIK
ncbi:T9SS type A sorting domain-containing protein [bacterium]|nr:MAG: T9SS type A sorting domain-containing protein [bacterium]